MVLDNTYHSACGGEGGAGGCVALPVGRRLQGRAGGLGAGGVGRGRGRRQGRYGRCQTTADGADLGGQGGGGLS